MRPLVAQIHLGHLRQNYQILKKLHGQQLLAVVKADAYGHGAVRCAEALADLADGFAVACIEEALELRQNGITQPIVLLEGVFEAEEYALVEQYKLWPVVQNQAQLEGLLAYAWQKPLKVWLKMDSGMGRVGFLPEAYRQAYEQLAASACVADIVKMTHFARADEPETGMTERQIDVFDEVCGNLTGQESLANSAGLLAHPKARRNWGRAGIVLYGVLPLPVEEDYGLKPVMTLKTRVFSVRQLKAGSSIGYGASYLAAYDTVTGVIACGYADGYPRLASTNSPVMVAGQRTRIVGRVSMDMSVVELTDLPDATIGSEVELWGEQISVNEVAAVAGTIGYELLCHVKRAKFVYLG